MRQFADGDSRTTVALLVPSLGMGGAERQVLELARALDKSRWRVLVIQAEADPNEYRWDNDGAVRIILGSRGQWNFMAKLSACLLSNRVQLVHAFLLTAQTAALLARALRWKGKMIFSVRDALPLLYVRDIRSLVATIVVFGCSPWVDSYAFNSLCGAAAKSSVVPASKRAVIYNGIDSARFRPDVEAHLRVRALLGLPAETSIVGMTANVSVYKDYPTFVEAARLVSQNRPDVHFISIGDDQLPESRSIHERVRRAGLSTRIHFLGRRSDVQKLAPGFDLGCLSSSTESFPNALAELMSCEVPCVATAAGDAAMIIGSTGIVVKPRDPVSLARGLFEALSWDKVERQSRGVSARARVIEQFSVAKMVSAHEKLYSDILRTGRNSLQT